MNIPSPNLVQMAHDADRDSLDGQIHVWIAGESESDPEVLDACLAVLSADERRRHRRFLVEGARRQYLVGRWLVRTVLSRYAEVAPRDWVFSSVAHGRPEVASDHRATRLRFNLSHTTGLVACVVCLDFDCGVDVELLERDVSIRKLAERYFSAEEAAALEKTAGADLRRRFFTFWTLKEAYLKARGLGISVPLRHASFQVEGHRVSVRLEPELEDRAADWQFALFRPTEEHLLSVAVRRGPERRLPLVARRIRPPGGEADPAELGSIAAGD